MSWLRSHSQSAAVVGLTLMLPLLLFLYALLSLWGERMAYSGEIERLQPRVARLRGLVASEQVLRESSGKVIATEQQLVYPQTVERASIVATLQKDVRKMVADAGLEIRNSQVLPSRDVGGLKHLTFKLQMGGELPALDRFLAQLADYQPLLLVESLDISPVRQAKRSRNTSESQSLMINLQLLVMRAEQ